MAERKREVAGTVTDVTLPAPAPTPKAAKKPKHKPISENPAASLALVARARRSR